MNLIKKLLNKRDIVSLFSKIYFCVKLFNKDNGNLCYYYSDSGTCLRQKINPGVGCCYYYADQI